ncbi:RteC domain-containing protein [Chryseobacterium sp. JK1]|uniref:RteC domain-containing protein n=1 Tax=Chryseobacterium sp. JK1 TaxID=874294 RepID=UPI003D693B7E
MQRELENELNVLSKNEMNVIFLSEQSLMKIDHAIHNIKKVFKETALESIADEVQFFKHYKPFFISKFIYYSKLLEIETSKPSAGSKNHRKYYNAELLKIKNYQSEQHDFYDYYRRNATYLDYKYFTRCAYDLKMKLSSNLYDLDQNFTTTHDHKIAVFIAHDALESYLVKCIKESEGYHFTTFNKYSSLQWTSSKVALLELLYALYLSQCFNAGNVDFSEIVRQTERNLGLTLGNVYKTLGEIKNRKYNKKRFLELLSTNLDKLFDEDPT